MTIAAIFFSYSKNPEEHQKMWMCLKCPCLCQGCRDASVDQHCIFFNIVQNAFDPCPHLRFERLVEKILNIGVGVKVLYILNYVLKNLAQICGNYVKYRFVLILGYTLKSKQIYTSRVFCVNFFANLMSILCQTVFWKQDIF